MQQVRRLNSRRSRPVLAMVLTLSLVASALVGGRTIVKTQATDDAPISADLASVPFDAGENVVVDDAAINAQGEIDEEHPAPKAVKQFERAEPFSMFALTWTGERDIAAFVRARQEDGSWGPWFDMDPMSEATGEVPEGKPNGSELIYVEPTTAVQVSTANVDMAAVHSEEHAHDETAGIALVAESQSDINAVFVDGKADANGGIAPVAQSDSYGMPPVVSRKGWGADESLRCSQPTIDSHVSGITIHHTAGSNNYTRAQAAGIVRGIYRYHAQQLGWCDIGYQSLVDKYGTIYEGRAGGMNKAVQGAHAGGFNQNTWAISMMGNYQTEAPTSATINAVGQLAGWRSAVAGFDPSGRSVHYSEGTHYSRYPQGQSVDLPRIFAHRDVGLTECPGDAGYAQMGRIRSIAKAKYDQIKGGYAGGAQNAVPDPAPAPNPAPGSDPALSSSHVPGGAGIQRIEQLFKDLTSGNQSAILAAVGTLAFIAISAAIKFGVLDMGKIGNIPVLSNLKLADLPPVLDKVAALSSNSDLSRLWNAVRPALGNPRGGVGVVGTTQYAAYDNGVIVGNEETGLHALWGKIGDAWAQQGFDFGPLGLPLNEEYPWNDLIRVDFQGGYITFDPRTGALDIQVK